MANIKSAKKRVKVIKVKTLRNKMIKSALKTTIKNFEIAVVNKNIEEAKATFESCVKSLDMATSKGVIHKNKAARRKSRLAAKLSGLSA